MTGSTAPAKTGSSGLDDILAGGLPRDRVYLFQGDPGVGKTTIGLQFLLAGVAAGEKCLYITLSESADEIKAVATSHGWDLSALDMVELSALEQSASLENQNTLFEPSEVDLHETTQVLLDHIERVKPSRVVLDSLSELRLLAQSALRYRRQILGLKQYFSGKHITVLLLDDLTSNPSDLQLQSLAHGVIHMEQIAPKFGGDRRRLRVLKLRGLKFRSGYHDFKIESGGVVVFPRLVAAEHHADFTRMQLSSGVAALDQLLGGGLDRGTATLVTGPAGSGKSVIASQYAVAAAARGENAVIFAFDERIGTLFERSRALGIPLVEQAEAGRVVVQQVDPAEMSPGEFACLVRSFVEDRKATVVVIDSLNGFLNAMFDEDLLTVQLHELLSYLGQQGVTTILVMAQHGLLGSMASPVDVSYLSDTVVLTRYFEAAGAIHKAISVVKKRSGPHENKIRELTMGPGGIAVGEPLSNFAGILTGVPRPLGGSDVDVS
jgi:circadian clock protein KaiC